MTFEIDVDGRTRTVSIETLGSVSTDGGMFHIRIDGVMHDVDVRPTDLGLSLMYRESGRSADVAVTQRGAGEVLVQLKRALVTAVVDARRFRRPGGGAVAVEGEHRALAPMPGRVLRVLVKTGETVSARQGLVVVEAMKMENEISTPKDGRVREIAVTEGQSVEAGRLLVVVE
jgi:biotin carboxyl carrier protein